MIEGFGEQKKFSFICPPSVLLKVERLVSLIEILFYFQPLLYHTIPTDFSIRWHDGTVVEHVMSMHPRMSSIGQDEAKL